ncbi:MAG TPA: ATP-binding cassette domain-containing protein [Balneolaceae bacterium]|nr:ATP-binding cassette domain-containing protein [Balneolaceae bacterium]
MNSFTLHVQRLSKHFGTKSVFNDISLKHTEGVLGIAGSNGSGKSTLLRCLAGLDRPTSGTVEWFQDNEPIDKESLKKNIGYAAPYINLYRELSCAENLNFLLELRGAKGQLAAAHEALKKTGIGDLSDQLFVNLSTGQQQRLRLAAALVPNPDILFLDEPGSNLDKKGRELIEELVNDFRETKNLVFIASNIPAELALCDRIYSVEDEKLVRK